MRSDSKAGNTGSQEAVEAANWRRTENEDARAAVGKRSAGKQQA